MREDKDCSTERRLKLDKTSRKTSTVNILYVIASLHIITCRILLFNTVSFYFCSEVLVLPPFCR